MALEIEWERVDTIFHDNATTVLKTTTTNILLVTITVGAFLALVLASLLTCDRKKQPVSRGE
mgnify:CR=1 FL=1